MERGEVEWAEGRSTTTRFLPGEGPVGVLLAALFFGALRSGSTVMEIFTDVPRDLVDVIQALIILFIAIDLSFTWWRRWRARRQESETAELQVA